MSTFALYFVLSSFRSSRRRLARAAGLLRSSAVIVSREICNAARLLIKRHGEHAEARATARSTSLSSTGDEIGAAVWHLIRLAVRELRRMEPTADEPLN